MLIRLTVTPSGNVNILTAITYWIIPKSVREVFGGGHGVFQGSYLQEVFPKREFCYRRERMLRANTRLWRLWLSHDGTDAIKTVPHICLSGSKSNDPVNFPEQFPLGVVVDGAGNLRHDATVAVNYVDICHAFS